MLRVVILLLLLLLLAVWFPIVKELNAKNLVPLLHHSAIRSSPSVRLVCSIHYAEILKNSS